MVRAKSPLDCLTDEDKDTICAYLYEYANVDVNRQTKQLEKILSTWDRNKLYLYHMVFHNQLRMSFRTTINVDDIEINQRVARIYTIPEYDDVCQYCYRAELNRIENNNTFIYSFAKHISQYGLQQLTDALCSVTQSRLWTVFRDLIQYKNITSNILTQDYSYDYIDPEDGKIKNTFLTKGSKTLKAIGKFLNKIGYTQTKEFDKWRTTISTCTTDKPREVEIVLSIHPIDFMTMSDNNCDWTTCASWINGGKAVRGSIETLNSAYAIVCYIESTSSNMYVDNHQIPNKAWRTLVYVHPDFILTGRNYPYTCASAAKSIVEYLRPILTEVFYHNYDDPELYNDMKFLYDNNPHIASGDVDSVMSITDDDFDDINIVRRRIFVGTGEYMYNDFFENEYDTYFISINTSFNEPYLRVDLNGPCTCMSCGDNILDCYFGASNSDEGDQKTCRYCRNLFTCDDEKIRAF